MLILITALRLKAARYDRRRYGDDAASMIVTLLLDDDAARCHFTWPPMPALMPRRATLR